MSWRGIVFVLGGTLLMFGTYCLIQTSRGYHLEWSSANMRFVWVDKEGKP